MSIPEQAVQKMVDKHGYFIIACDCPNHKIGEIQHIYDLGSIPAVIIDKATYEDYLEQFNMVKFDFVKGDSNLYTKQDYFWKAITD